MRERDERLRFVVALYERHQAGDSLPNVQEIALHAGLSTEWKALSPLTEELRDSGLVDGISVDVGLVRVRLTAEGRRLAETYSRQSERSRQSEEGPPLSLEEKRRLRTQFMEWLYTMSDGDQEEIFDVSTFASERNVAPDALHTTIQYLEGEGLVEPLWSMGPVLPDVSITHRGVLEVEQALAAPDQPTEHFAPMINITNIQGNVVGSQIQQGSPGATQTGDFTEGQKHQFMSLIEAVERDLAELQLDPDEEERTTQDLTLLRQELARPAPRPGLVRELVRSLRTVVEGAAGGVAASGLLALPWPT